MKNKVRLALAATTLAGFGAASSIVAAAPSGASVNAATATSAKAFGGLSGLIKAAKAEGNLNVITLPDNWANYGNIEKDFTKKYGIKIHSYNPEGSSANELTAMQEEKGQSDAPDVLDISTPYAVESASDGLLAPYKVASWSNIPSTAKAANATWWADYGGFVSIGCDTKYVKVCPTSFKQLLEPQYKGQVALNGDPTDTGAAFAAVYAAALANGGSFSNITPGIQFFAKLHSEGNFVPVTGGPTTVESGATPILIWWDYLEESEVAAAVKGWKVAIPSDGHYASYYDQAIYKYAPHPAAARLWEEYLYSVTGQNLWLQGYTRPIELTTLVKDGTVNKKAYKSLPKAPAKVSFPTQAQETAAENVVTAQWPTAVG